MYCDLREVETMALGILKGHLLNDTNVIVIFK